MLIISNHYTKEDMERLSNEVAQQNGRLIRSIVLINNIVSDYIEEGNYNEKVLYGLYNRSLDANIEAYNIGLLSASRNFHDIGEHLKRLSNENEEITDAVKSRIIDEIKLLIDINKGIFDIVKGDEDSLISVKMQDLFSTELRQELDDYVFNRINNK